MRTHGHVFPHPQGAKARCGGPGMCLNCKAEKFIKDHGLVLDQVDVTDFCHVIVDHGKIVARLNQFSNQFERVD